MSNTAKVILKNFFNEYFHQFRRSTPHKYVLVHFHRVLHILVVSAGVGRLMLVLFSVLRNLPNRLVVIRDLAKISFVRSSQNLLVKQFRLLKCKLTHLFQTWSFRKFLIYSMRIKFSLSFLSKKNLI